MKVPHGWILRTGESISSLITKGESPGWQGFEYQSQGVIFITSENVRQGRLDVSEPKFITNAFHKKLRRSALRADDILINLVGASIGRSCIFKGSAYEANINQEVCLLRPSDDIHPEWISFYLQEPSVIKRLIGKHGDSARANISISDIREFDFAVPPLPEQRKIAEILGTWDQALEKLDALIQAKERRKKALMQQLLTGKKRVKGFSEPWRTRRFQDLLLAQDRYVEFNDEHTYNLVSIRRRSGGVFFREALKGSDIKTKVMKRVHQGDFVISRMQVVHGALGMVRSECDGMYGSDSYDVFVAKDSSQLHMPFLDWMSRLRSFWNLTYICSHGVHIEKMTFNLEDFMREKIEIPSEISEQQEIAAILDTCDEELRLLHAERAALDQQKRGLMQKLLTGRVRVRASHYE